MAKVMNKEKFRGLEDLGIFLYLFHYPKMRQAQYFQRRRFGKLQHGADEFSKDAGSGDDVVVCAEDDGTFDEFDR